MTNDEQISKQKVRDENLLRKRQKEEDDSDEEFFCVKVKKRKSMKDTKSDCNNKVRDVNCDENNNFDSNGDSLDNDDFSSDYYQIEKNISEDDHNFPKLHRNQIIEVDVDDVKKSGKKNGVSVTKKKNKDDEITNMDDKLFQWVKQYYYGNRVRKAIIYPTTIQSSYTTLPFHLQYCPSLPLHPPLLPPPLPLHSILAIPPLPLPLPLMLERTKFLNVKMELTKIEIGKRIHKMRIS